MRRGLSFDVRQPKEKDGMEEATEHMTVISVEH